MAALPNTWTPVPSIAPARAYTRGPATLTKDGKTWTLRVSLDGGDVVRDLGRRATFPAADMALSQILETP